MSSTTISPALERIESILDPGSFVEIGAGMTARNTDFNLNCKKKPSDGVVTGYGLIFGKPVYIYSQDPSVLNGTLGEIHAKKIVRMYETAIKIGAPVIGLLDSAGMRLEEGIDALDAFGSIYRAMSAASGIVPLLSVIYGKCGGGMAMIPGLSDFCFIESEQGKMFINSPDSLPENHAGKCDNASAAFQMTESGLCDDSFDAAGIAERVRHMIAMLPSNPEDEAFDEELTDDLNRDIPGAAALKEDPAYLLGQIADAGSFVEAQKEYGKDIVTGFLKLGGTTVGVVANRSVQLDAEGKVMESFEGGMTSRGAKKAAKLVRFCDAFNLPIITFTNVKKFHASVCSEMNLAREVSALINAFAECSSAKINVILNDAFGSAGMVMNTHALGADLVYAWEDAKIGMIDGAHAAKLLSDDAEEMKSIQKEYDENQNSLHAAASRGYVDAVIAANDTRKYLIGAIEMLFTKREMKPEKKHSTI